MTLVRFDDVSLEFGDQALLKHTDFAIEDGERVCLIGRNGTGKSSMLRLISQEYEPDHGEIRRKTGLVVSQLKQTLPESLNKTVFEYVSGGLVEQKRLIEDYQSQSKRDLDPAGLRELETLQARIEAHGGWHLDQRVQTVLSELDLPSETSLHALSGGWRRRVGLARALVSEPELLLLDEPTNHLDLGTIEWLEGRVINYPGSVLFITHDRAFLNRLATRIVELDRGRLTSWPGNYHRYLDRKAQFLSAEGKRNNEFDKRLNQEEVWIRTGIKARRTRNEGRVRALQLMREERAKRLKPQGKVRISIEAAEQSGRKVIEARNIHHGFRNQTLIADFSLKIMRGDRIGLIGNNGVGKSTLLRILLTELQPQRGSVKLGTNLEVGYLDQLRRKLDPDKTVAETVGDGSDYIKVNGKDRHIIGYLRGFLFSPKRAMSPIRILSGGECNRVLLAKLFTRASNLLVLDEPTNDLDTETLDVLEQKLVEYQGSLIVVSHDRVFLDNVVTSVLVFEQDGQINEYVGGYSDWLEQGRQLKNQDDPERTGQQADKDPKERPTAPRKLTYKLQRELDLLPGRIDKLETSLAALQEQTADPDFYNQAYENVQPILDQLSSTQTELDQALARWTELEGLKSTRQK